VRRVPRTLPPSARWEPNRARPSFLLDALALRAWCTAGWQVATRASAEHVATRAVESTRRELADGARPVLACLGRWEDLDTEPRVWHITDMANECDVVTPEDWQGAVNNLY
jgi:hypothetical protein